MKLGIYVRDTGKTWYMGPKAGNSDGLFHAATDTLGGGSYYVGFEDLDGGGDQDYNDVAVSVGLVAVSTSLSVSKTVDRATAQVGDSLTWSMTTRPWRSRNETR